MPLVPGRQSDSLHPVIIAEEFGQE